MNTLLAEKQIKELIDKHLGDKGWCFRWDTAVRRFGACHHNFKMITLSKALVELNDWEQVKDTTLHEIAHALAGKGAGHNYLWKYWCREIGARPERCYPYTVVQPKAKWQATCTNCGRVVNRCRKPNGIACGACWRKEHKLYKLNFKKTK